MNRSAREPGFPMIESFFIIVILGILADVTVFAVRAIAGKGNTRSSRADQKTIVTAVESCFAQYSGAEIPYTGLGAVQTGVVDRRQSGRNAGRQRIPASCLGQVPTHSLCSYECC